MNEPKTQYELPTQVLCHYVIIKECMNAASESFLDGKERHELTEKIKQIPLLATTATRCAEIFAEDVQPQIIAAVKSAPCIASAVVESTDISDMPSFWYMSDFTIQRGKISMRTS